MTPRAWLRRHDTTRIPYACPLLDIVIRRLRGSHDPDAALSIEALEAVRAILVALRDENHAAADVICELMRGCDDL